MRRVASRVAAIAAIASSTPAAAQELPVAADAPREQARARTLFQRGAEAYSQGRYDEAISLFQSGDRLASRPAFSYNLAVAFEGKGEPARALEHYRNYRRRGADPRDAEKIAGDIRRLEAALAERGVQQVTIHATPVASLAVDGREVGTTPWTGELTPGNHELVARPTGKAPIITRFELPVGRAVDVHVAAPDDAGSAIRRPAAWAMLGVTSAAATVGSVLGGIAWNRKSELDESCGANHDACPAGSEGDIESYETTRNVSYVSFAVAAASAVTMVVLFAVPNGDRPSTEVSMAPYDLGTGGSFVSLRHSF